MRFHAKYPLFDSLSDLKLSSAMPLVANSVVRRHFGCRNVCLSRSLAQNLTITEKEILEKKSEMAVPSAFFSGTEDKDNVHVYEEIDDDVLLIEEQLLVLGHCIEFPRSRSSSPCLFVYVVRYAAAYT